MAVSTTRGRPLSGLVRSSNWLGRSLCSRWSAHAPGARRVLPTARLPGWFTHRFPARYHRKRLFDEPPGTLLNAAPVEKRNGAPRVSAPGHAFLEKLSEVGVPLLLQEARELAESAYSMRADTLRELLQHCISVKTVRLCLQLGRELSMPWSAKLDPALLPTGSARAWVSRSVDGLLVLKP